MLVYTANMLITVWYGLNQFAFNLDFLFDKDYTTYVIGMVNMN